MFFEEKQKQILTSYFFFMFCLDKCVKKRYAQEGRAKLFLRETVTVT